MKDENEIVDSTTNTEEETVNETTSTDSEVDVVALKEQNKKLFERAKKAEEKLKQVKPAQNITKETTYGIEDEVLDLRLDGYSKSEVEFIMKNGGKKILEDETSLTSIAIRQKRQQEKAENAADLVTDTTSQSDVERKYTPAQLRSMPLKELEAILPKTE